MTANINMYCVAVLQPVPTVQFIWRMVSNNILSFEFSFYCTPVLLVASGFRRLGAQVVWGSEGNTSAHCTVVALCLAQWYYYFSIQLFPVVMGRGSRN